MTQCIGRLGRFQAHVGAADQYIVLTAERLSFGRILDDFRVFLRVPQPRNVGLSSALEHGAK